MDVGGKTLIAIDDSPAAELAFRFYDTMLRQPNGSLLLLHVVEPRIISSNQTVLHLVEIREKAAKDEKKRIRELQEKYEDRMRTSGIKGRIVITYYSRHPGKVICQTAASERCSMIIIGYSSKSLCNQVGSVCKYVFRNSPCPIAIVPSRGIPETRPATPRHRLDLPPDYDTARRFSLAVPVLRRASYADIKRTSRVSSCPDISELGDDYGEDQKSKPHHKMAVTDAIPDLRMVTAQIHETKL